MRKSFPILFLRLFKKVIGNLLKLLSLFQLCPIYFLMMIILFTEASAQQARVMKSCLEIFCQASGQVVNFEKLAIFCSSNTSKDIARDIICICGSPFISNLSKYLGMPLIHSRVTYATYTGLIDKVHKRLAS